MIPSQCIGENWSNGAFAGGHKAGQIVNILHYSFYNQIIKNSKSLRIILVRGVKLTEERTTENQK